MNFEEHVATMDGEDIEHWIKVRWGIIDFAKRTDLGALAFLRSHIGAAAIVPAEVLLCQSKLSFMPRRFRTHRSQTECRISLLVNYCSGVGGDRSGRWSCDSLSVYILLRALLSSV